jgi:hypothetical protein
MRLYWAFFLMLLLSSPAIAGDDPFDPGACAGPAMTNERALELLGRYSEINLANGASGGLLRGQSRVRQKMGGAIGKWYDSAERLVPVRPYIVNADGFLGFKLYYFYMNRSPETRHEMTCTFIGDNGSFTCLASDPEGPKFGSGAFSGVLKNNCMRMFSSESSNTIDREWAFLIRF